MKKLIIPGLLIVAAAAYYLGKSTAPESPPQGRAEVRGAARTDDDIFRKAFESRRSGVQVEGAGIVEKVLKDDLDGSRHQRFIVRLATGQTILIAHNIDLAPRVASIANGDDVTFAGVYEWNRNGGTVHWTHHDPKGTHPGGWITHRGSTYR